MPTQFDLDSFDSVDHSNNAHHLNNAHDDDVSSLPLDAQELYHRLTREGADTRDRLARIDQRLQEHIAQLSATHVASRPNPEPESLALVSAPPRRLAADQLMRRAPRYPALRRWVTMFATAAVVIAYVAVLATNAGHRRSAGPVSHQTPTGAASPTSAPTTDWIDLTRLDYSTSFSANDLPAVAPSNPHVVYETMAQGMQQHLPARLRATNDGGVTWRTLATPVPADHIGHAGIIVSPTNPQTIFLSLIDTTVADCPANSVVNSEAGYQSFCWIQYSSFDGGAQWSLTDLPLAPGSTSGMLTAGFSSGMPAGSGSPIISDALGAQGQRLFAGYLCVSSSGFPCIRLVTSDDGGRTWSFADRLLLAGGAANVCDYIASASSADLFAVTTPTNCDFREQVARTLWHSVDAGATWVKVRQLATPNEEGMALAHDHTTGATLLYMAAPVMTSNTKDKMGDSIPVFSQAASDVKVSTDGGATWQSAPTKGIPSNHTAFFSVGLLGPLSDGSVVIDVIPPSSADPKGGAFSDNFQGSDLYAWKPGDSGWRLIGSVTQEMDGLLVIPTPTGDGDSVYAFLTTRSDANTFSILQKHVAP